MAHLKEFAEQNSLLVEHGIEVQQIVPDGHGFVIVTNQSSIAARHVIIATGRDGEFNLPVWKGSSDFTGELLHAANFGYAARYAGRSVLVIGAGNSGFDILNHLARVQTKNVWLSARGGTTVLPKRLKGFAVHRLSPLLNVLPLKAADAAIAITQRVAFGDLEALGFSKPSLGGATRLVREHIAIPVDDGAIAAIRKKRISVIGEVGEFTKDSVLTKDGQEIRPDVAIAATGYTSSVQALHTSDCVTGGRRWPETAPGLWTIGMRPSLVSYFRNALWEAEIIARKIGSAR